MTREEAIDLLDNLIGMVEDNHQSDYDTALQMAIKALKQMPVTTTVGEGGVIYYPQVEGVTPTVIKQEPCEDAISRQAALGCCRNEWEEEVEMRLKSLPSVNPTKNVVNNGTMNITL